MDPSDYQKDPRPPVHTQLSTSLPGVHTYITTHDPASGKSVVHSSREAEWSHFDDKNMGFNPVFTNAAQADLNDEKDITENDEKVATGKMGLVRPGGTVCRHVDLAPGYECLMHRTQSLDFGIILVSSAAYSPGVSSSCFLGGVLSSPPQAASRLANT